MNSIAAGENSYNDAPDASENLGKELIWEIFDWLQGLSNAIEEQSRELERLTGLSKNQALVIKALSQSSAVSVTRLAKSMCLNPTSMVRVLGRLEELGLVTRSRSKTDRRVVELGLTEKAGEIELLLQSIAQVNLMRFSGADVRELLGMLGTLQKLSSLFFQAGLK